MAERTLILDAERFPSNTLEDRMARSKKEKEEKQERPKVEKVIEGTARKRKTTLGQKFKETFIMEETDEIAKYICGDVIVPTLKTALFTIVTGGLSLALFGTVRGVGKKSGGIFGTVDYNGISSGRSQREARAAKARHSFEDLTFEDKFEADDVLEAMRDMVDEYGQVSIADMYELAGVSSDPIDRKWGWTSLRTASVIYSRDGYIIDLPKTKPVEV